MFSNVQSFLFFFFAKNPSKLGWKSYFEGKIPFDTHSTATLPSLAYLKINQVFFRKTHLIFQKDPTFERFEKSYYFSFGNLGNIGSFGNLGDLYFLCIFASFEHFTVLAFFALFAFFAFFEIFEFVAFLAFLASFAVFPFFLYC